MFHDKVNRFSVKDDTNSHKNPSPVVIAVSTPGLSGFWVIEWAICLTLILKSAQARCAEKSIQKTPFETRNYLYCLLWPLAFMHHKHTQTEIWAYFWADVSVFHQRQRQSFAYLSRIPSWLFRNIKKCKFWHLKNIIK